MTIPLSFTLYTSSHWWVYTLCCNVPFYPDPLEWVHSLCRNIPFYPYPLEWVHSLCCNNYTFYPYPLEWVHSLCCNIPFYPYPLGWVYILTPSSHTHVIPYPFWVDVHTVSNSACVCVHSQLKYAIEHAFTTSCLRQTSIGTLTGNTDHFKSCSTTLDTTFLFMSL